MVRYAASAVNGIGYPPAVFAHFRVRTLPFVPDQAALVLHGQATVYIEKELGHRKGASPRRCAIYGGAEQQRCSTLVI